MKAMIFAAGLGTRLKPLTDTMPKALVPVGGKPLLQHLLERLASAGFDDLVVNVHHFADMIEQWVAVQQAAQHFSHLQIAFSDERSQLLETGGGIRHAAPLLSDAEGGRFLIHNVDILSNVNLKDFWQAGAESEATLLVSERETLRYLIFDADMRLVGWTNIKTGEVKSPFAAVHEAFRHDFVAPTNAITSCMQPLAFLPSEHQFSLYAFAGIHQLSTKLLPLMNRYPDKFSIIDFYLQHCHDHVIRGYVQPDLRLMDVGKIDTLSLATQFVEEVNAQS
ncbi:MAG: NTP transferase domain-containing protein [Bacteroidales bacterium]|nr:NTP transferase domain-containing protein [Candidatus Physcousia equi]